MSWQQGQLWGKNKKTAHLWVLWEGWAHVTMIWVKSRSFWYVFVTLPLWPANLLCNWVFQNHMYAFYFGIVLDLQQHCRECREFPYGPRPTPPIVNILHHCSTFVETGQPALVHCYSLNYIFCFDFTSFPLTSSFWSRIPCEEPHYIKSSCLFSLLQSMTVRFLAFHDFDGFEKHWPNILWQVL